MQESKVIKIIKSLPKDEIKLLGKFVSSPIHNKHQQVIDLFFYIKKHLDDTNGKLSKEKVFKFLFPKQKFEPQKIHYINSYLFKVVEAFLAWQEWKNDKVSEQIYLYIFSHSYSYLFPSAPPLPCSSAPMLFFGHGDGNGHGHG